MREDPNNKQAQDLQELIRQNQERLLRNRKTLKEIDRRTNTRSAASRKRPGEISGSSANFN
jgi:hypothetical protein